jgi:hypothetical protein
MERESGFDTECAESSLIDNDKRFQVKTEQNPRHPNPSR